MIGSKRVSGGPRSGTFLRAPERLGREYGGGKPGQRGYRDVARRSRPDSGRVEPRPAAFLNRLRDPRRRTLRSWRRDPAPPIIARASATLPSVSLPTTANLNNLVQDL